MSNVLTDPALTQESEVPSVEGSAGTPGEVEGGSTGGVVDAARFNGLMGRFHQEQQRAQQHEARTKELEAELEALRSQQAPAQETTQPVSETSGATIEALQAQVSQLTELLTTSTTESAKEKALAEFPEAKPFADLIVASNPAEMREMAQLISERVKSAGFVLAPSTETETTTTTGEQPAGEATGEAATGTTTETTAGEATTQVPVTGGGATFDAGASVQDRVTEAIKNKDFGAFLRAKTEAAEMAATTTA